MTDAGGYKEVDRLNSRRNGTCNNCGRGHNKGSCPAYGMKCYNCNSIGHFSSHCRKKNNNQVKSSARGRYNSGRSDSKKKKGAQQDEVEGDWSDLDEDNEEIGFIGRCAKTSSKANWTIKAMVNEVNPMTFKVDT